MYARKLSQPRLYPITQQCQECDELFSGSEVAEECPECHAGETDNLIVLHMEEDSDRREWLQLVDFSAGD